MSTSHALVIPAATMAALRGYADVRRVAGAPAGDTRDLLRKDGPLTPSDREALLNALQRWKVQRALADGWVREITARLTLA